MCIRDRYEPYDANVIVVDRDNSDLSRALTKHLGSRFELVTGAPAPCEAQS